VPSEIGKKLQELEQIVNEELVSEGAQLAHAVAEHVLTCYWSWDLSSPLEPCDPRISARDQGKNEG
jgi:hypothetical protein